MNKNIKIIGAVLLVFGLIFSTTVTATTPLLRLGSKPVTVSTPPNEDTGDEHGLPGHIKFYVISGIGSAPGFSNLTLPVVGIMTEGEPFKDHGFVESVYTDENGNEYRALFSMNMDPINKTFTGTVYGEVNGMPFGVEELYGEYQIKWCIVKACWKAPGVGMSGFVWAFRKPVCMPLMPELPGT